MLHGCRLAVVKTSTRRHDELRFLPRRVQPSLPLCLFLHLSPGTGPSGQGGTIPAPGINRRGCQGLTLECMAALQQRTMCAHACFIFSCGHTWNLCLHMTHSTLQIHKQSDSRRGRHFLWCHSAAGFGPVKCSFLKSGRVLNGTAE